MQQLKLEYKDYVILFKSGSFYVSFDEDSIILNKLFNYKIGALKNNIKVGFPVTNINKNISILKDKKINYISINNIYKILIEMGNDNLKLEIIIKYENLLYSYRDG